MFARYLTSIRKLKLQPFWNGKRKIVKFTTKIELNKNNTCKINTSSGQNNKEYAQIFP